MTTRYPRQTATGQRLIVKRDGHARSVSADSDKLPAWSRRGSAHAVQDDPHSPLHRPGMSDPGLG